MEQMQDMWNKITAFFIEHGMDFVLGLIVLIVCLVLVKIISVIIRKIVSKTKGDGAVASFIISLCVAVIDIVIIIGALSIMGLNLASILTVVATGGVAIGLALKDSLGNVASGLIIIVNKPFKKGDFLQRTGRLNELEIELLVEKTLGVLAERRIKAAAK